MGIRLHILASRESIEDLDAWQRCEAFDCIETPTGRDSEIYERLQHIWSNSHDTYVFGAKFRDEMDFLLAPQRVDDALIERVRGMQYEQPSLHEFLSARVGMNIVGLLTD